MKIKLLNKALIFIIILCTSCIIVANKISPSNTNLNDDITAFTNNMDKSINTSNAENNKVENNKIANTKNEYLVLANKQNSLGYNYEPSDLVQPNIRLRTASEMTSKVRKEASTALENMFADAKKDNIYLIGISGYRSYDYQTTVYNNSLSTNGTEHTSKYVAKPGHSEHQTGLVMDVLSTEYDSLDSGFENTASFRWLYNNMSNYGFILRYPKGKENVTGYQYEPWHLRYVGKDAAKEIMEKQLTLEEYLQQ